LRTVAARLSGSVAAAIFAGVLAGTAASMSEGPAAEPKKPNLAIGAPDAAFETFLDRLMHAESSGRDDAANPRSTALGAFQFIRSTFVDVVRRHFASEVATLDDEAVLALRTNRDFARRAASAFSKENLAFLSEQGLNPTFGHLRLAFLVGPTGAARLLQVEPTTPVADILGSAAITANPFMKGMNAADLIARATRDVGSDRGRAHARSRTRPGESTPAVAAVCSRKLPSCRRWIALRVAKLKRKQNAPTRNAKNDARPGAWGSPQPAPHTPR